MNSVVGRRAERGGVFTVLAEIGGALGAADRNIHTPTHTHHNIQVQYSTPVAVSETVFLCSYALFTASDELGVRI